MPIFRLQSIMVMSSIPALLLGLGMIWAWLRLRDNRDTGWAVVLGALTGWAAITRPVDALCVAIPIGVGLLIELRRQPLARTARILALIVIAAMPFLAVQAAFNLEVTGCVLSTPFDYSIPQTQPQTHYGFHTFDPSIRPRTHLPQKHESYDLHVVPFLEHHTPTRRLIKWRDEYLSTTILNALPHPLLLVFLPAGLVLMNHAERWVLLCILPMFVLLYFPYAFFMTHYTLIAAPSVLLLVVGGAHAMGQAARYRGVSVFTALALLVLAASSSSLFNRTAMDEWMRTPEPIEIDRNLAAVPEARAIVLFRFASGLQTEEPVYNLGVLWPDNALIIRAHDLGERNIELYRYYARCDSGRVVYLYDRGRRTMTRLGPVGQLVPDLVD